MGDVKSYDFDESFIIEVRLDEENDRVCDYCNKLLVVFNQDIKKLVCVENCHVTDYGLLCDNCKSDIAAYKSYKKEDIYII